MPKKVNNEIIKKQEKEIVKGHNRGEYYNGSIISEMHLQKPN